MQPLNKVRRSVATPEIHTPRDRKGGNDSVPFLRIDQIAPAGIESLHASTAMLSGGSRSRNRPSGGPTMRLDQLQARLFGESGVDRTLPPEQAETPPAAPSSGSKTRTRAKTHKPSTPITWQQTVSAIAATISRHQAAQEHGRIGFKDSDISTIRAETEAAASSSALELCDVEAGGKKMFRNVLDVAQGEAELITPQTASSVTGIFSSGFASCVMISVASADKKYLLLSHEDNHDTVENNALRPRDRLEMMSQQPCSITLGFALEAYLEDAIHEGVRNGEPAQTIESNVKALANTIMSTLRDWAVNLEATLIDLPRAAVFLERGTGRLDCLPDLPETSEMDPDLGDSQYWHAKRAEDLARAKVDLAYEASGDEE